MGEEKIILALPDNKDRNAINAALRQSGYSVIQKRSGQDILDSIVEDIPEIILMHADLPKVDGWQVCEKLKEDQLLQKIGIILCCDDAHESDIIRGFELGADEVFDANVSARELVARTQALSRRLQIAKNLIKIRDLEIELDAHRVLKDGKTIDLTYIQFKLLYLLASRRDNIFSRSEILERVWGKKVYVTNRTVDVHIKRLREKLGEIRYPSQYIQTIHGVGYRFM